MMHGSAGHPPAVLLHADGSLERLNTRGPIIGLGGLATFEEERKELSGGDKLIYYTDGIIEYQSPSGAFYGKERFYTLLQHLRDEPVGVILEEVIESLMKFGEQGIPQDDISLFGLEFKA